MLGHPERILQEQAQIDYGGSINEENQPDRNSYVDHDNGRIGLLLRRRW
jgi:hypothetical protein